MKHVLKLCKASQGKTIIDDIAVVNPATNKCMNKSEYSIVVHDVSELTQIMVITCKM